MINLNELSSADLMKIAKIRQKIEVYEAEQAEILKNAKKREPPVRMILPRTPQPFMRDMIRGVLQTAGVPMSVLEIYEAGLKSGFQWRSQEPINSLTVKMYTDKTFKKVSPGRFALREKGE
jgi:hypothetical protein